MTSEQADIGTLVELATGAPVLCVRYYAPHPCGGWYVEDAKVYGLNVRARPVYSTRGGRIIG